jgi:hypothetical protein
MEICANNRDDDCDGQTDEGCATCTDADGDGYFVGTGCESPPDCDDTRASVHPGAAEMCGNDIDEDCDGQTDEGCGIETCNPQNPAGDCGMGMHCVPSSAGTTCQGPAGTGAQGASCSTPEDCAPAYACAPLGDSFQCLAWCHIGWNDCPGGETCFSVSPPIVLGGVEYGLCVEP